MSWPQNPNDPQQQPQPAPGFGPPPDWPPTGGQPAQPAYSQQPPQQQPQQPYAAPQYAHPTQPPVPPPPGGGRKVALAVTGVVVAVAVIGTVAITVMHRVNASHDKANSAHASASAPVTTVPSPTLGGPDTTAGPAEPMYPGWQTQTQQEHGFRYDVPPVSARWTLVSPDVRVAYTDSKGNPQVVMSGTADYREGGCASQGNANAIGQAGKGQLATVGTQGSSGGTLQANARNVAGNWGFMAYGGTDPGHKPHVTVTKAVPWKHNGIDGYTATATVTGIYRPSPCVPATATARGISQRLADGTISEWVLYADQGVPDALTPAEIGKIMSTVRPATGS